MSIIIKRKEPELLYALPRLLARLPENYPNIEELNLAGRLYQVQAGYSGELKVDRYLEKLNLPESATVLTDVQLSLSQNHSFQIDTLIITQKYILILEVKNIIGNLHFKSNPHQLIRELNGDVNAFECPITQMEVAKVMLKNWFSQKGINIEVHGIVVLANHKAIVKESPPNASLIYLKRLAILLCEKEQMKKIYSLADIQKIKKLIEQSQAKYKIFPLCKYYRINPNLLIKGQLCANCNRSMIYKSQRVRYCESCKTIERNNPMPVIQDWFMLVDNSISNRQCIDFLKLKNRTEAYYIIKSLKLHKKGSSVSTRYFWPQEISFYST